MSAPAFTLNDMHTDKVHDLEDYKGKALMITFWTSSSPDSQRDLANKEKLYRAMQTDKFDMLMINVTGLEHKEQAAETYYKENDFTFPVAKDDGTKIYDKYQCMSVPTTYLLDKDHEIVSRFNDKASFPQMLTTIGEVIAD
ncbi:TlpA disulfide reductase family protein [Salipaludibacillus sp. CF4.18]|uniref:TlpA disulfide reductase family protein n=1 Tax=Salipaludibacillus sp. CF4.18 TaxID=3373081 RepID=UPI003EE458EF